MPMQYIDLLLERQRRIMARKKVLVICVDRDDDIGRKTSIRGPILGEEKNIKTAEALAIADPEDTDTNSIFSAISTYREIKKTRDDAEIVTLTGDISVGMKSDSILVKQLEDVLSTVKPDAAVLVSDGAEDEHILPLIQSRVKISSVRRVVIKQSRNIQSMYYLFLRFLEDEKIQKTFIVPIALGLLVWAIGGLLNVPQVGFMIILLIGIYFLIRAYKLEDTMRRSGKLLWEEIVTGKLSFFTFLIALTIFLAGGISTFSSTTPPQKPEDWVVYVMVFIEEMLIWVVAGILVWIGGKMFDVVAHEKKIPWRYVILSLWAVSIALIISAALNISIGFIEQEPLPQLLNLEFFGKIIGGVLILVSGSLSYRYIREAFQQKNISDNME
jgi:putative membrane protein